MEDEIIKTDAELAAASPKFRWRVVPATIQLGFGIPVAIVVVLSASTAVYMNIKHGWIIPNIRTSELNRYAMSPKMLLDWLLSFWAAVANTTAGWAWWKGRWLVGWIATAVMLSLMGLASPLGL